MKRDARMNPCSKGKVQMQMLKDIRGRITAGGNGIPTQDMPASAASITSWVNENQTAPASKPIELLQNWALQGYLWVTGTPFSLEYPSLRGGFGWHDISWKHHFQV